MRRYQADHGWQSKTVPDSRASIKLGLGPSHDHLLNPESAMTTAPEPSIRCCRSFAQHPDSSLARCRSGTAEMNAGNSSAILSGSLRPAVSIPHTHRGSLASQ